MYHPIATYLNHFSENMKKALKKAILKVENDVDRQIPAELRSNLKKALSDQWDILSTHEGDKNIIPDVPSLRSLQIANGNLPRYAKFYILIYIVLTHVYFSFAFHTVVEFVSFKLGHFLLIDDLKKGII